jgi:BolA family transcriptional regulator, general stress-responsive regulator
LDKNTDPDLKTMADQMSLNEAISDDNNNKQQAKSLPDMTSPYDEALMKRKRNRGKISPISFELPSEESNSAKQGPVYKSIMEILVNQLNPYFIELIDDSASHAGHAGAASYSGESHFKLSIASDSFEGLSRVKRHQLVYGALGELMQTKIHALNVKAQTVGEYSKTS